MAHRGLHKKHYWPERSIVWSRASAAAACKTLEWCERGHKDGRKSGCLLFHFADSFQGPDVLQTVIDSQLHHPQLVRQRVLVRASQAVFVARSSG